MQLFSDDERVCCTVEGTVSISFVPRTDPQFPRPQALYHRPPFIEVPVSMTRCPLLEEFDLDGH